MPDHLSEDGKDFIRQCLQRNPVHRPSAAQLLLHPFVKIATLGRPVLSADPLEAKPDFVNTMRSLVKAIRSVHDTVSLKFLVSYSCFSKICASI